MPPHGPGMTGGSHSHDPAYPDDNFNLYQQLDIDQTTALNVTTPTDCVGIFKPYARRLETNPFLISDADEEIIIIARFISPVSVRKIVVMGNGESSSHPQSLKCYPNQEDIDFTSVGSYNPAQTFNLPVNTDGSVELTTVLQPFSTISSLTLYFNSNYGADYTTIQYIGLQGEHTHYRREAVDATYEVLCTGQDIEQPEEARGSMEGHMH